MCDCRQDARRRQQFRDHTGNRITLEAVLNTTCSKCGCKGENTKKRFGIYFCLFSTESFAGLLTNKLCFVSGHFTKDCFSAPGLQYALVPEEGDDVPQQQTSTVKPKQDSDKKKKKKVTT